MRVWYVIKRTAAWITECYINVEKAFLFIRMTLALSIIDMIFSRCDFFPLSILVAYEAFRVVLLQYIDQAPVL